MAKFSLGEMAFYVWIGHGPHDVGTKEFTKQECQITEVGCREPDLIKGETQYAVRFACGTEIYTIESCLRKLPGQSKEDQEARERFLKGCHEKPNFHEILSDLQPVTEETARKVFENSMWSVK